MSGQIRNLQAELLDVVAPDRDTRWSHWAKRVDRIDEAQRNGYMYVGEFINRGTVEVRPGRSVYIVAIQSGSRRYRTTTYTVVLMHSDGTLETTEYRTTDDTPGWALRLRDAVMTLLREQDTGSQDVAGHEADDQGASAQLAAGPVDDRTTEEIVGWSVPQLIAAQEELNRIHALARNLDPHEQWFLQQLPRELHDLIVGR